MAVTLISAAEIQEAADRLAGRIVRTPLLPVATPDTTRPLLVKPENLQTIGAFKVRGALNAVATLDPAVRARGVVTHSSGNHAQAVALAARIYDVPAVIVMTDVSPAVKVAATKALGAEVVLAPPAERRTRVEELVAEHGYAFVPPFDHRDVIAGQGTVGLEIVTDLIDGGWVRTGGGSSTPRVGPWVGTVLVPVGGGGLLAGVAAAIKALRSDIRVIGVEPELAADLAESVRLGRLVTWPIERTYQTIADGMRVSPVGDLPWEHVQAHVDDVLTVSEDTIRAAMRMLATQARLVAEPSGAVATAAYLSHAGSLPAGPVVAVVSGGNVEPELLASVL